MGIDNNYQNASMKKVYGKGSGCLTLIIASIGIMVLVVVVIL